MTKMFEDAEKNLVNSEIYVSTFAMLINMRGIPSTRIIISNGEVVGMETEDAE